jgi:hypothetical protein
MSIPGVFWGRRVRGGALRRGRRRAACALAWPRNGHAAAGGRAPGIQKPTPRTTMPQTQPHAILLALRAGRGGAGAGGSARARAGRGLVGLSAGRPPPPPPLAARPGSPRRQPPVALSRQTRHGCRRRRRRYPGGSRAGGPVWARAPARCCCRWRAAGAAGAAATPRPRALRESFILIHQPIPASARAGACAGGRRGRHAATNSSTRGRGAQGGVPEGFYSNF